MSRRIFQRLWFAPLLLCAASGAWAQTSARMPCETLPQYKQFDFWIGEWEVTVEGRKVADSSMNRRTFIGAFAWVWALTRSGLERLGQAYKGAAEYFGGCCFICR